MGNRFFSVAATLLLVPLVTLGAQGPPGPPQAPAAPPAGPDAVPFKIVTTACSTCHNLDRVRTKVGDSAAWTATVTRMRERGAGVSDQEAPQVIEFLTRAAATLPAAPAGGGRGGGRGGPVAPFSAGGAAVVSARNLKVLTAQNVEFTMQQMTFALGLRCIDCHEMNDLALDTKPLKAKALGMLEMTRDINARFGDGQTRVTCWTCHRGSTMPEIVRPVSK